MQGEQRGVGPSVFFSLLVIAVAFLPIFALVDHEGRLLKPLAVSKNLANTARSTGGEAAHRSRHRRGDRPRRRQAGAADDEDTLRHLHGPAPHPLVHLGGGGRDETSPPP